MSNDIREIQADIMGQAFAPKKRGRPSKQELKDAACKIRELEKNGLGLPEPKTHLKPLDKKYYTGGKFEIDLWLNDNLDVLARSIKSALDKPNPSPQTQKLYAQLLGMLIERREEKITVLTADDLIRARQEARRQLCNDGYDLSSLGVGEMSTELPLLSEKLCQIKRPD